MIVDTPQREKALDDLYRRAGDLAKTYYFAFRRPRVTVGGLPVFLLLGNHSSGKSTLINSVLGDEPVQDVGIAPTDDGFTFIVFGEEEYEVVGTAALALLPAEYKDFERFGTNFLQHLKVKVRNRPALKEVVLVDSPGMIDSTDSKTSRDYDFPGVVRRFAELADMIFFLFDPDKPGTTGETVKIFAECLDGVQYKLRVILNKCDLFTSTLDFARAYGTLCWNLARVMKTKDLPRIVTLHATTPKDEVRALFADSADRRGDNIFAQAAADFRGLSVRMGVINAALTKIAVTRLAILFLGLGVFSIPFLLLGGSELIRRRVAKRVDEIFAEVFRAELATKVHDDLLTAWEAQREEVRALIAAAPLKTPFFAERRRRRLEANLASLIGRP